MLEEIKEFNDRIFAYDLANLKKSSQKDDLQLWIDTTRSIYKDLKVHVYSFIISPTELTKHILTYAKNHELGILGRGGSQIDCSDRPLRVLWGHIETRIDFRGFGIARQVLNAHCQTIQALVDLLGIEAQEEIENANAERLEYLIRNQGKFPKDEYDRKIKQAEMEQRCWQSLFGRNSDYRRGFKSYFPNQNPHNDWTNISLDEVKGYLSL